MAWLGWGRRGSTPTPPPGVPGSVEIEGERLARAEPEPRRSGRARRPPARRRATGGGSVHVPPPDVDAAIPAQPGAHRVGRSRAVAPVPVQQAQLPDPPILPPEEARSARVRRSRAVAPGRVRDAAVPEPTVPPPEEARPARVRRSRAVAPGRVRDAAVPEPEVPPPEEARPARVRRSRAVALAVPLHEAAGDAGEAEPAPSPTPSDDTAGDSGRVHRTHSICPREGIHTVPVTYTPAAPGTVRQPPRVRTTHRRPGDSDDDDSGSEVDEIGESSPRRNLLIMGTVDRHRVQKAMDDWYGATVWDYLDTIHKRYCPKFDLENQPQEIPHPVSAINIVMTSDPELLPDARRIQIEKGLDAHHRALDALYGNPPGDGRALVQQYRRFTVDEFVNPPDVLLETLVEEQIVCANRKDPDHWRYLMYRQAQRMTGENQDATDWLVAPIYVVYRRSAAETKALKEFTKRLAAERDAAMDAAEDRDLGARDGAGAAMEATHMEESVDPPNYEKEFGRLRYHHRVSLELVALYDTILTHVNRDKTVFENWCRGDRILWQLCRDYIACQYKIEHGTANGTVPQGTLFDLRKESEQHFVNITNRVANYHERGRHVMRVKRRWHRD